MMPSCKGYRASPVILVQKFCESEICIGYVYIKYLKVFKKKKKKKHFGRFVTKMVFKNAILVTKVLLDKIVWIAGFKQSFLVKYSYKKHKYRKHLSSSTSEIDEGESLKEKFKKFRPLTYFLSSCCHTSRIWSKNQFQFSSWCSIFDQFVFFCTFNGFKVYGNEIMT